MERFPWAIALFVLGALIGSFLNVVIARLPAGESIVHPRSRCPHCHTMIPGWLNIPVLSWLFLRGRCRACKAPISVRYPMVELLTASLFLACWSRFGLSAALLLGLVLSASLVAITFIDIDTWEIADEISIPGVAIGAALRPWAFDVPWYSGLIGAALGAAFLGFVRWAYAVVRKQEGMGLGDVKLIAMIGAFLGPGGLLPTILLASVAGSVIGGVLLLVKRLRGEASVDAEAPAGPPAPAPERPEDEAKSEEDDEDWVPPENAVPFGPFLALGALAQLLFGPAFERLFFELRLMM